MNTDGLKIPLHNKNGRIIAHTLVDLEVKDKLSKYTIFLWTGYARCQWKEGSQRKLGLLHRILVNAKRGEIVDHKNRNKLDNRLFNLRIVSPAVNAQNHAK